MAPAPNSSRRARRLGTVLAACVLAGLVGWSLLVSAPGGPRDARFATAQGLESESAEVPTGPTGPEGSTGPEGPTGPTGPTGPIEPPPVENPPPPVENPPPPPVEAPPPPVEIPPSPPVETPPPPPVKPAKKPKLPSQKAPKLKHYGKRTADGPGFLTGIGDEHTEMFKNVLWKRLHTGIARYIVPWDAATRGWSMFEATRWIRAAEKAHQQILIAFYHSEYTPLKLPTSKVYKRDVAKFMKAFPEIKQYQPWNETNRGTIRKEAANPGPMRAAEYYRALKSACKHCQVVGLDILDQNDVGPTIRYIKEYKKDLRKLHTPIPRLWGLHNYSDTNRFGGSRTTAILKAIPGNVWVTETGGLVKFGGAFPNKHGEGLRRAAKAIRFTFKIAREHARIKRLYIYDWSGGNSKTIFDAGLTDIHDHPRPGYVTLCEELHAGRCKVKTSKV